VHYTTFDLPQPIHIKRIVKGGMKYMKKYQIIYTLIPPNGDRDTIGPILMYATTENILKQHLDKELHRRLGDLYQ
jgi:hypothetical protein